LPKAFPGSGTVAGMSAKLIRAIFPASFDPIHNGHIDIANRAVKLFDELIVAVYEIPDKKLMFSAEERMELVQKAFAGREKIRVVSFNGLTVDFCREIDAQVIVRGLRVFSDFEFEFRLALANHQLAPEIETVSLITSKEHTFLSSTTVREIASLHGNVSSMVPDFVNEAFKRKFPPKTS
jgi:pantetheine-phosphate adenylyltransferase